MMSYATSTELTTYATDRGITLSGTTSVLLIQAHDYLETLNYKGSRTNTNQLESWPRQGVYVDGIRLDSDVVPQGIKNAEMRLAIEIDRGYNPLETLEQTIKSETIGPIETEYMEYSSSAPVIRSVMTMLGPYLAAGGGFEVSRG